MLNVKQTLDSWKSSLCNEVEVGGLFSRNPVAHKWKAPWRGLLLRECVAWRVQDLLEQSHALQRSAHLLGARILLRSAFETLAVLIYLNQSARKVSRGVFDFHEFSARTTQLLIGSRDKTTPVNALNIVTVLSHADKRYPGLEQWYAGLSESAHPNYEGMLVGYSRSDKHNLVTRFANRWSDLYGGSHLEAIRACMVVFDAEYNHEWIAAFSELEEWIAANDDRLESTKPLHPDA
jgi:hypothetical protein